MPLILHLETSTEVCSVCLSKGTEVLALQESSENYSHSSILTTLIHQVINTAGKELKDLNAVSLSIGPGSYTSLRIGSATAKGICYAMNIPLIGISTLYALAHATIQKEKNLEAHYVPMIDARRMEVYCSTFDSKGKEIESTNAKIIDETSFQDYFSTQRTIIFSGNGAEKCKETLQSSYAIFSEVNCKATHLVIPALQKYKENIYEDIAYFSPQYFKSPNITTPRRIL